MNFPGSSRLLKQGKLAKVLHAVLLVNIFFAFASTRSCMLTLPVELTNVTMRSRHMLHSIVERYLTPPHATGGSGEPFWLPVPSITDHNKNAILLPCTIRNTGHNEYGLNTPRKEEFTEVFVDRGEVSSGLLDGINGKAAFLVTSRDAKIGSVEEPITGFPVLEVEYPSIHDIEGLRRPNDMAGLHWVLAYVTDGAMRPAMAINSDPAFCRSHAKFIQKGWSMKFGVDSPIHTTDDKGTRGTIDVVKPAFGGVADVAESKDLIINKPHVRGRSNDRDVRIDAPLKDPVIQEVDQTDPTVENSAADEPGK